MNENELGVGVKNAWLMAAAICVLSACGGDSNDDGNDASQDANVTLRLGYVGQYATGSFDTSAAEIPAYDAASQRLFVVNAEDGVLDVLNFQNPQSPTSITQLAVSSIVDGAQVNSVAVSHGIVAVAIEAENKTDNGYLALYQASDLTLLDSIEVGPQPDMVAFTPDGNTVLTANEGEPSDDYQTDPEGSISIIDATVRTALSVQHASFNTFDSQRESLLTQGVRIYGPNASVSQDLEPEYIAVSDDGATAWVTLQENNALAKVDIASATITDILPLGVSDRGLEGQGIDASDDDDAINIATYPGVVGMYQPDAIHAYTVDGDTYLVTANEGDARAWGEDNSAYWGEEEDGDTPCEIGSEDQGFVEEFRVKHLVHPDGLSRRCGDDLPPQLAAIAEGALLDPAVFAYCGAQAGSAGDCRDDATLGRLKITWVDGFKTDSYGLPLMHDAMGNIDVDGTHIMYERLYSYGGRSFSIWDEDGTQVFDSGDAIEQLLASDECRLGQSRQLDCADYFNSEHDEGDSADGRSDAKGPEPEGLTIGHIEGRPYLFLGLERMGGVVVFDISDPSAPQMKDYFNSRETWDVDPDDMNLAGYGDLGPEGLVFIHADDSPSGEPLLVVGNEVSGTTAVYSVTLTPES